MEKATYYVLCTNDTERKWTMSDLLSIYKKQSVVERNWKYLKDRKILVGALFLESPSRINALMWLMTLALLIFSATEYLMRKRWLKTNFQFHLLTTGLNLQDLV